MSVEQSTRSAKASTVSNISAASTAPSFRDVALIIKELARINTSSGPASVLIVGGMVALLAIAVGASFIHSIHVVSSLLVVDLLCIASGLHFLRATSNPQLRVQQKLAGCWWEFIKPAAGLQPDTQSPPKPAPVLSFFKISTNQFTGALTLSGRVFDARANRIAGWESTANHYDAAERRLRYFWKGECYDDSGARQNGWGEFQFDYNESDTPIAAHGRYGDITDLDQNRITTKSTRLVAVTKKESRIINGGDLAAISAMVATKLQGLD